MPKRPTIVRMLGRALLRRCPNCGTDRLFDGWFRMRPACPRCGLPFEREEGFFLGAFVINFGITEGSLALFLVAAFVATAPDPPVLLLATTGAVLMVLVPLAFYPFSKTVWTAIHLVMQPYAPFTNRG